VEGTRVVDKGRRHSKAYVVDHVLYGGGREVLVRFGEISTISPSRSADVLVTVSAEETSPSKIRLQRRLLFAPIPRICLEGEIVLRGVQSLQEFWLTMPLEVRSAREIAVEKFSALSPEEVRRATMLHLEHIVYDDLQSREGGALSSSWIPPMFVFLIVLIILHMYLGKYLYME
jgi:hypothetical protein